MVSPHLANFCYYILYHLANFYIFTPFAHFSTRNTEGWLSGVEPIKSPQRGFNDFRIKLLLIPQSAVVILSANFLKNLKTTYQPDVHETSHTQRCGCAFGSFYRSDIQDGVLFERVRAATFAVLVRLPICTWWKMALMRIIKIHFNIRTVCLSNSYICFVLYFTFRPNMFIREIHENIFTIIPILNLCQTVTCIHCCHTIHKLLHVLFFIIIYILFQHMIDTEFVKAKC